MANRLIIRHGNSAPTTTDLLPYELGWDGSILYINSNGTITALGGAGAYLPITGGTLTGNLSVTGSASFSNTPTVNGTSIALTTDLPTVPSATSTTPIADGIASVGSENTWAKGDHIHPTDTTRAPIANPIFTGIPKVTIGSSDVALVSSNDIANMISSNQARKVWLTNTASVPSGAVEGDLVLVKVT